MVRYLSTSLRRGGRNVEKGELVVNKLIATHTTRELFSRSAFLAFGSNKFGNRCLLSNFQIRLTFDVRYVCK